MDHSTHDQHHDHVEQATPDHEPGVGGRHDRHEGHSVAMFRDRFWLSLLLTIPVVAWSPDL